MAIDTSHWVGPDAGLVDWLAAERVDYVLHEHPRAEAAADTAEVEHVDPKVFAKVVAVTAGYGRNALFVVPAHDYLDLHKAASALEASHVRLLTEAELEELAPDDEVGALPAVGSLYGLPTYADRSLGEVPRLYFNAGSHRMSVEVDRADWARAARVVWADLRII